jgi:hypothetical protein
MLPNREFVLCSAHTEDDFALAPPSCIAKFAASSDQPASKVANKRSRAQLKRHKGAAHCANCGAKAAQCAMLRTVSIAAYRRSAPDDAKHRPFRAMPSIVRSTNLRPVS